MCDGAPVCRRTLDVMVHTCSGELRSPDPGIRQRFVWIVGLALFVVLAVIAGGCSQSVPDPSAEPSTAKGTPTSIDGSPSTAGTNPTLAGGDFCQFQRAEKRAMNEDSAAKAIPSHGKASDFAGGADKVVGRLRQYYADLAGSAPAELAPMLTALLYQWPEGSGKAVPPIALQDADNAIEAWVHAHCPNAASS